MVTQEQVRRDSSHDPTRVREQPQLTSASGTTWIVVAALSTLLLSLMLVVFARDTAISVTAVIVMGVLLVSMVMVRALIASHRIRLAALAALYFTILGVGTVATLLMASPYP